jgi:hypothetical protein
VNTDTVNWHDVPYVQYLTDAAAVFGAADAEGCPSLSLPPHSITSVHL